MKLSRIIWTARAFLGLLYFSSFPGNVAAQGMRSRSSEKVAEAKTRFESTSASYKRGVTGPLRDQPVAQGIVGDIKFVFDPSVQAKVEAVRRFGEYRIVLSDGWYSAVEDMTRAAIVTRADAFRIQDPVKPVDPKQAAVAWQKCFNLHVQEMSAALLHNAGVRTNGTGTLRPLPRFEEVSAKRECQFVTAVDFSHPKNADALEIGMNAALHWVIGREIQLLLLGALDTNVDCPRREAQRWSVDRAFDLRVDPVQAYPAVIFDALLQTDGSAARCPDAEALVEEFFDRSAATRTLKAARKEDAAVKEARDQAIAAWRERKAVRTP